MSDYDTEYRKLNECEYVDVLGNTWYDWYCDNCGEHISGAAPCELYCEGIESLRSRARHAHYWPNHRCPYE